MEINYDIDINSLVELIHSEPQSLRKGDIVTIIDKEFDVEVKTKITHIKEDGTYIFGEVEIKV